MYRYDDNSKLNLYVRNVPIPTTKINVTDPNKTSEIRQKIL